MDYTNGALVSTTDVARFFAFRAKGLDDSTSRKAVRWHMAPACVNASFAPVTASLHVGGTKSELPLAVSRFSPTGASFNEVYAFVELDDVALGATLFRVTSSGRLEEFTNMGCDFWRFSVTENMEWAGQRLTWLADDVRAEYHELVTGQPFDLSSYDEDEAGLHLATAHLAALVD